MSNESKNTILAKNYSEFVAKMKVISKKDERSLTQSERNMLSIFKNGKISAKSFDFASSLDSSKGLSTFDLAKIASFDGKSSDITKDEAEYFNILADKYEVKKQVRTNQKSSDANSIIETAKDLFEVSDGRRKEENTGALGRKEFFDSLKNTKEKISLTDDAVIIPTDELNIKIFKTKVNRKDSRPAYNYLITDKKGREVWNSVFSNPKELKLGEKTYPVNSDGVYETDIDFVEKSDGYTKKGKKAYKIESGAYKKIIAVTDSNGKKSYFVPDEYTKNKEGYTVIKQKGDTTKFLYDEANKRMLNVESKAAKVLIAQKSEQMKKDFFESLDKVNPDNFTAKDFENLGFKHSDASANFLSEYKKFVAQKSKNFLNGVQFSAIPEKGEYRVSSSRGRTINISVLDLNNPANAAASCSHEYVHAFIDYYKQTEKVDDERLKSFLKTLTQCENEKLCEYTGVNIQETYKKSNISKTPILMSAKIFGEDPVHDKLK